MIDVYKPRQQFLPFHCRSKRWACLVSHRRSGKTVASVAELITRALASKRPDYRGAYVAPFRAQAKTVAWDYLKYYTQGLCKPSKVSESDLSVELVNGSRIRLFGSDNPNALRGIWLDGCVLDEFADMRPSVWGEIIRPMLADRHGWATFIGTPRGKNSFWAIHDQAQRSPEWFSLVLRASESGLLPAEEIADMRRNMTEDQFEQELQCSFDAAIQGAFYGREMREAEAQGRITKVPPESAALIHTAWDLGYSDDTAIWFWQIVSGEVRLIDYYASNGEGVEHYCRLIQSKPYKYGNHWVPHDAVPKTLAANGRSIIQQMHSFGVKARVAPDLGVQDGIQAVRLMLPRCWFDAEKCSEGIEALKQYRREYDEERKDFRAKPRHGWESHACLTGDTVVDTERGAVRLDRVCIGDRVWTPVGYADVTAAGPVKVATSLIELTLSNGTVIRATPEHKFFTQRGILQADALRYTDTFLTGGEYLCNQASLHSMAANIGYRAAITELSSGAKAGQLTCTGPFGNSITALFRKVITFITAMVTGSTTISPTWSVCLAGNISPSTPATAGGLGVKPIGFSSNVAESLPLNGMQAQKGSSGTQSMANTLGKAANGMVASVRNAVERFVRRIQNEPSSAISIAKWQLLDGGEASQWVYDLTVAKHHCYRANGVLVSNSDAMRYLALVWREEHKPEKPEPKIRTIHDATLDELWDLQRKQTGKRI